MDLLVLDDTGSSLLSLNFPNDFILLGYQLGEIIPVQPVEIVTANRTALRNTTSIQINFKDSNGAYMGKSQISEYVLNHVERSRCFFLLIPLISHTHQCVAKRPTM